MSDWTPPLNEHLFTLNGLWTYTRLRHTNAPPLNRHPQPWNIERFFFPTLLSKSSYVLHPKIEWTIVPKIVHLWHSTTTCIKMGRSELHTLEIHLAHVCVCVFVYVCALIEQWPEKGNTLRRPWDKRPTHRKTCQKAWLWELGRNQRLSYFMSSSKRSNRRWWFECPS